MITCYANSQTNSCDAKWVYHTCVWEVTLHQRRPVGMAASRAPHQGVECSFCWENRWASARMKGVFVLQTSARVTLLTCLRSASQERCQVTRCRCNLIAAAFKDRAAASSYAGSRMLERLPTLLDRNLNEFEGHIYFRQPFFIVLQSNGYNTFLGWGYCGLASSPPVSLHPICV